MTMTPTITLSDLSNLTPQALAPLLRTPETRPTIIDVRTNDHIGGHIATSRHIPADSLDYQLPELVRTLEREETVVFHCALSQQRGPRAAVRYVRERVARGWGVEGVEGGGGVRQRVCVLEGGWVAWQELWVFLVFSRV